jgi:hypothetical protein
MKSLEEERSTNKMKKNGIFLLDEETTPSRRDALFKRAFKAC